jgi:hypothetical protein
MADDVEVLVLRAIVNELDRLNNYAMSAVFFLLLNFVCVFMLAYHQYNYGH